MSRRTECGVALLTLTLARTLRVRVATWLVGTVVACLTLPGCSPLAGPPPEASSPSDVAENPSGVVTTGDPEAKPTGTTGSDLPFQLPPGYVGTRVAASPLITHPMFACFDDRGRLYVAGSSGLPVNAAERRANPPDLIRCLEDTDGDGTFDKSTVFADRLTFPQGVLWHDGAVYTASPPSLWRLKDNDGDGVADERRELVTGFAFTGIADDLHGPTLGPDGRLYWGVGRFDYDIHKPGGPSIRQGQTPLIMRCRPDGEAVEVFSAAMGNPVEVAFTREGEAFACGTFLSPEAQGEGLRDALIHCIYGGLYSVRDRDLAGEKRTGDLLPPLAQLGVAAGSGLMLARGGAPGDRNHDSLYAALFNLHSVPRFVLERDGSTFRAREESFLTSSVADFHPTDVLEDADGSILVVDTGGWFRGGCPTSQVEKPYIQGAIYRIRRPGVRVEPDPWGLKIDWARQSPGALARRLYDRRFAVRDRAADELARRGEEVLPALRQVLRSGRSRARLRAVWALARIAGTEARAATRSALADDHESVRLAAVNAVGLHRDNHALDVLLKMLRTDSPPIRREVATALGRLGRGETVPPLLDQLRDGPDRFLQHALIFALIRIADRNATLLGLSDPSPAVRRGALIALDQMPEGRLNLDMVSPLLDAGRAGITPGRDAPRRDAPRVGRVDGRDAQTLAHRGNEAVAGDRAPSAIARLRQGPGDPDRHHRCAVADADSGGDPDLAAGGHGLDRGRELASAMERRAADGAGRPRRPGGPTGGGGRAQVHLGRARAPVARPGPRPGAWARPESRGDGGGRAGIVEGRGPFVRLPRLPAPSRRKSVTPARRRAGAGARPAQ